LYADRLSVEGLEGDYPDLKRAIIPPDVIADAEALPFASSLDFIIASHILEHLHFPLAALRGWYECLVPGGILLLRVPDKRFTLDAPRQRTTLDHLIREHSDPKTHDLRSHYADWVEHIYKTPRSQSNFESSVDDLMGRKFSIHCHVWTQDDVRAILDYTIDNWNLSWRRILSWNAHFYRKEVVVMLRKN
jgi:predicted SAM-dependent methyltransferase